MSMAWPIGEGHRKNLKTLHGPDFNITVTRSLLSSLREPIELLLMSYYLDKYKLLANKKS